MSKYKISEHNYWYWDYEPFMTFHERKKVRTEHYNKYIKGWKLRECGACSGSGYYDHNGSPKCESCNGSGKERYNSNIEK